MKCFWCQLSLTVGGARDEVGMWSRLMSEDEKIQDVAVAYIRRVVMQKEWSCTSIGELRPELRSRVMLQDGELPIASAFFGSENWYAFTTRQVIAMFRGVVGSINARAGIDGDFGNFKGYGNVKREVATIRTPGGESLQFEFATWEESMVPIYATQYWIVKHRALKKLMTTAERQEFTRRREAEKGTDAGVE